MCSLVCGCLLTRADAQPPGGREGAQGSQALPRESAKPAGPGEIKFRITRRPRGDQAGPAPDQLPAAGRIPFVLDPGEAPWTLLVNDNSGDRDPAPGRPGGEGFARLHWRREPAGRCPDQGRGQGKRRGADRGSCRHAWDCRSVGEHGRSRHTSFEWTSRSWRSGRGRASPEGG